MYVPINVVSSLLKNLSPDKTSLLLNKFYQVVLEISRLHGGLMFEHGADSAKIVFGAPQPIEEKEKAAVDCALALKKAVDEFNKKSEESAIPIIQVSIGISSGETFCGAIGAIKLKSYSILGDPVVEAIQMESIATIYGATIMACNATKEVIKDQYHIREVDIISKPGFSKPVTVFEVISASGGYDHDMMSTIICYELGLSEYRAKNWQAATMHFKKAQTLTDDFPAKYMADRCRGIIDGRYDIPEDWDTVWELK
jgi:adenylate cyclase